MPRRPALSVAACLPLLALVIVVVDPATFAGTSPGVPGVHPLGGLAPPPAPGPSTPAPAPGTVQFPSASGVLVPIGTTGLRGFGPADARPAIRPPGETDSRGPIDLSHPGVAGFSAPVLNGSFSPLPQGHSQTLRGAGFQGIDDSQCGCDPPDVQDAAGPNQVVEMVNLYMEVWDQNGTALAGKSLGSFYGTSNTLSDPRVIYDNLSGRYFASVLEFGSTVGTVYFAVSKTSNAAGNWTLYKILSTPSGTFPDQPMMGVNATLLGFGGNVFGGSYAGAAEYWVVNKSAVLNGTSAAFVAFGPDTSSFSVHPARTLAANAPLYFVETYGGNPGTLQLFKVSGIPPAATSVSTATVSVGAIASPPPAPTPGGGGVDTATPRVADALWWNDRLYVTFGDQCTLGGSNLSCVRLDVVNLTTTPSVYQDFDVARAATYLYYPAISLTAAGDLGLVFGLSSATLDPSIAAAGQRAGDPPSTLSPFAWIHRGSAGRPSQCNPACRFGDFFGSGTDPTTGAIWVSGEYLTSATNWQTWLAPTLIAAPSLFSLQAPAVADLGAPVNVTLTPLSSPCGSGWQTWCVASFPLGNGSTYSTGCLLLQSPLVVAASFSLPGNYTIGAGGTVTTYAASDCSPGSLVASYPVNSTPLRVYSALAVSLFDDSGDQSDVGENVTFTAQWHGGAPGPSINWTGLPAGCPVSATTSITCAPTTAGTSNVTVRVVDSSGTTASASLSYRVFPPPFVDLTVGSPFVDVGGNLTMTAVPQGGTGSFDYLWSGLPLGCPGYSRPDLACSPLESGIFNVSVQVTDSRGFSALSPFVDVEVGARLTVHLTANPAQPAPGSSATLRASISGGLEPYAIRWTGLPDGCASAPGPNATCAFPSGNFAVTVAVTDLGGGAANATLDLVVAGPGASPASPNALLIPLGGALLVAALAIVGVLALRRRRRAPSHRRPNGPPARSGKPGTRGPDPPPKKA